MYFGVSFFFLFEDLLCMCDIFDRNDLNAKDYYVYRFYFSGHIFPHLENIAGENFMYIQDGKKITNEYKTMINDNDFCNVFKFINL